MKTYSPKPADIEHRWYVVDASGQVLGRLASEVAALLRGKHKPIFAPHMDTGDHVIVLNADKIELTGQKADQKFAYRHSGYPGGITATRYRDLLADRPVAAIEKAVRGMLPHNRLGRQIIKKLHVVAGPEHRHQAQQPVAIQVGERPVWDGFPVAKPAAVKPRSTKPSATAPAATEPGADDADEPAEKKTTTAKEPAAKKTTAAKKPAAKKPAAKKPAAKKPAAKKTTAKKTTAKKTTATKPAADETEE